MNRIFKTVWNVARRALVVVNEKTGIGQSRCAAVGQGTESTAGSAVYEEQKKYPGVPSAVCLALASVFVFWGGNVEAAFPFDFAVTGLDGGETFAFAKSDPIEPGGSDEPDDLDKKKDFRVEVLVPGENGEWIRVPELLSENLKQTTFDMDLSLYFMEHAESDFLYLVFGSDIEFEWNDQNNAYDATSNHFSVGENPVDLNVNATNVPVRDEIGFWGSAGNFTVEDGKTLVLFGEAPLNGSYLGDGKTGTVRDGTLTFGLPYKFSEFKDGLSSGDTGPLILYDGAKVVFQNGVYSTSRIDIQHMSNVRIVVKDGAEVTVQGGKSSDVDAVVSGEGFVGIIENIGSGNLTITGGIDYSAGKAYNAFIGGTGTISNIGKGTLTISGGSGFSANGIGVNAAYSGSTGEILNAGYGALKISGGIGEYAFGIGGNGAYSGSTGKILNAGAGTLTIVGGSASHAYGISDNAINSGNGTISNEGEGTLTISGGSANYAGGINFNASHFGTGTITNTGAGTLTISGGSGPYAHGIYGNANDGGIGTISNTGAGTLTITGGSGDFAYGIAYNAYGGTGTITNGEKGTLNIMGNLIAGSYGIGTIADRDSVGRLENAGEMNLNKNAIESFGDGDVLVTNKATGTVNADAEAIFEKTESTSSGDSKIGLLNPSDGAENDARIDGFGTSGTVISWDLKDDWANRSVWEDGGVLNVTDVVEGSLAAQQIESAFTALFGTGTALNFLGEDDWASEGVSSSADSFTASIGNALIDQGYAGNIVTNFNLNNAASDGSAQALTIGTGEGQVIKDSLGFRQVEGVSSVTVNNGKYFALIGLPAGGELIRGGAPVALDNGTLMLGVTPAQSAREDSSTSGTLETVTMANNSAVEVENMWVRIDSVKGQGDVTLTETGRLYVKDLNVEGDVDNDGLLSADSVKVSGGTLTTTKTLKSEGKISVTETGTLSADGILASDTLDVKGVLKLGQSVSVYTGAAALKLMRERHADVAADLDRLEGKAEVSTMSVLDRIVAESMKKNEATNAEQEGSEKEGATDSTSSAPGAFVSPKRRAAPVLPQDAQAFAAFDAVKRVASTLEGDAAPDGHGLWAKLLTGESEFGVRSGAKFEIDTDGAVIGAEAALNPEWKVGGAVSYLDGEIDAGAGKTNWSSYGMHAYFSHRAGDFALKGTAGWLRGTTEASKDYDADVWHAGIRSEYDFRTGPMTVTPFLGGRVMSGSFDGMSSQTVVSVPLGAKLSGELNTAGWTIAPSLEAAYVRSMGDTDAEDVRFLPENAFEGSLSLKAEKGAWTGELSYRGAVGSNDYEDRAFEVRIGVKF